MPNEGMQRQLLGLLTTFSSPLFFRITMAFAFEKLEVYQKAVSFADRVCQATDAFSRGYGFLSDQLNRAALSIAANIAEGNRRFT